MINAVLLGQQFNSLLPPNEVPERTEGYEGFYHLMKMNGDVEKQHFIILFAIMTVINLTCVKNV